MKKKRTNIPFFTFLIMVVGLLMYGYLVGFSTWGAVDDREERDAPVERSETLYGDEALAEEGEETEPGIETDDQRPAQPHESEVPPIDEAETPQSL